MIIETPTQRYEISNLNSKTIIPLNKKIFLAGTIDMGNSMNWQQELIFQINNLAKFPKLTIFNPRRETFDDDSQRYQIIWEQDHLDEADEIVMYLAKDSKSPISLLELGLYAQSGKLKVFCHPDFYRFANVNMTCEKYDISLYPIGDVNPCEKIAHIITGKKS